MNQMKKSYFTSPDTSWISILSLSQFHHNSMDIFDLESPQIDRRIMFACQTANFIPLSDTLASSVCSIIKVSVSIS